GTDAGGTVAAAPGAPGTKGATAGGAAAAGGLVGAATGRPPRIFLVLGRNIGPPRSGATEEEVPMETLDVRPMPPRERHATIFGRLDELPTGATLRLLNDHDPAPLRYQLEATRPGQFRWEYVEEGPEQWAVDITKTARVVDARPTLAAGGEPFDEIMAAAAQVGEGEVLVVYAPFEPVPLEGVLGEQGFRYVADQIDGGDWRVTFRRG